MPLAFCGCPMDKGLRRGVTIVCFLAFVRGSFGLARGFYFPFLSIFAPFCFIVLLVVCYYLKIYPSFFREIAGAAIFGVVSGRRRDTKFYTASME